jgi:serine/threonine protein phosphatase PrpC
MKFPWQKNGVPGDPAANSSNAPRGGYSCQVYSLSETGPARRSNEDSILFFFPRNNSQTLFALVADGMGGHNAGEVASHIACQSARGFILTHYLQADMKAVLEEMVQQMHKHIRVSAEGNAAYYGMGTTATALFIRDGYMYYAHVGDSRLYHYANNELSRLTTDHTLVNQLIKDGKLTEQEAEYHHMKHVLMQALGSADDIVPEISATASAIHKGEYYLLCTDGLYGAMPEQELKNLLAARNPGLVMESIKAWCYRYHASDNFSAILVEITAE